MSARVQRGTHRRSCRTCGWKGTYSTAAKADYSKSQHSCARWQEKARTAENGRRILAERARIDRTPKPCHHKKTTHQHGTHACYVLDTCRCIPCSKANSDYESDRNKRNAYGRSNYVDAKASRDHIRSLMNQGMGLKRIVAVSDISQGLLSKLLYGKKKPDGTQTPTKRVRRDTEQRILAISLDLADGAVVDGTAAVERLRSLVALGWSMSKIARRLGFDPAGFTPIIHGRRDLTFATFQAANALFGELSMTLPPRTTHRDKIAYSRARNYAAAAGWVPPLDLEDLADDVDLEQHEETDGPLVDEAAVWRAVNGDRDVTLTIADRREVVRILHARELSDGQIAEQTGMASRNVLRIRQELSLPTNSTGIRWADYGEKPRQRERQPA